MKIKIIPCPACGRRVKPQKYCPSCGCYLPPLLEEEEINYNIDYIWYNKYSKFVDIDCNTYSKGYNTYFMGQNISSPNVLQTTDLNNTAFTIHSQTQATQEQINQSMKQQIAQLNCELRQYEMNLNNNAQTQYILNQLSSIDFKPYQLHQNKTEQEKINE